MRRHLRIRLDDRLGHGATRAGRCPGPRDGRRGADAGATASGGRRAAAPRPRDRRARSSGPRARGETRCRAPPRPRRRRPTRSAAPRGRRGRRRRARCPASPSESRTRRSMRSEKATSRTLVSARARDRASASAAASAASSLLRRPSSEAIAPPAVEQDDQPSALLPRLLADHEASVARRGLPVDAVGRVALRVPPDAVGLRTRARVCAVGERPSWRRCASASSRPARPSHRMRGIDPHGIRREQLALDPGETPGPLDPRRQRQQAMLAAAARLEAVAPDRGPARHDFDAIRRSAPRRPPDQALAQPHADGPRAPRAVELDLDRRRLALHEQRRQIRRADDRAARRAAAASSTAGDQAAPRRPRARRRRRPGTSTDTAAAAARRPKARSRRRDVHGLSAGPARPPRSRPGSAPACGSRARPRP